MTTVELKQIRNRYAKQVSVFAFLAALVVAGCKQDATPEVPSSSAPRLETMDNYSFAVGVWCAERVLQSGRLPLEITNPVPILNHSEILHAARHFSQTNGWLPFNNRIGFTGDE